MTIFFCQTRESIVRGGAQTGFPLPMRLEALVNSRIQKIRLSEDNTSKARLQRIQRSLWSILLHGGYIQHNIRYYGIQFLRFGNN